MKGFMRKAAALAILAAGAGCYEYRDIVDPCYPLRYNAMARQEVNSGMAPQVQNGHVLDQTVWNYFFEAGTDRLTPLGLDRLAYLARRRPCPDANVYLQTAQDLVYDQTAPERMAEARQALDDNRKAAVQRFLVQQTAGHPVAFTIVVHDPAEVGLSAIPVNNTVLQSYARFRGGLQAGGNVTGGAGAAGVQGAPTGVGAGTGR
jgi:hypothetical protein